MANNLEYLEGLKYNYKGENIIIQKVKKVSGNFIIITDKRTFNFLPSEIEEFEKNLETWKNEVKKVNDNFDIQAVLIDTINRVKNDSNYIQQANAICNVTSQMINIKKLELQLKK